MKRGGAFLLAGFVAALGGCQPTINADQLRLCRIALVGLAPSGTQLTLLRQTSIAAPAGSVAVRIVAAARNTQGEAQSHSLDCRFGQNGVALPDALIGATFDRRVLSDAALFFLRRFWLATTEAEASDPEPIRMWRAAPTVSPALAHGLQSAVAAMPGLATYGLTAMAYALVYGLLGRINFAFGALAAVGGAASLAGLGLVGATTTTGMVVTALLAGLWAGAVHGAALARLVFRPLEGKTGQQALIATIGLAFALEEYLRIAQGPTPAWVTPLRSLPVGLARAGDFAVTVTPLSIAVAVSFAITVAALMALMRLSRFGRNWRAMADDPLAAALLGIDPGRLITVSFALAAALAGAAGAVTVLVYGSFGSGFATVLGLKALLAAVLGGIGSIPGALLGALAIASAEAAWSAFCPIEYRDLALYVALAAFIVFRPGGLLGFGDLTPRRV